MQTAYKTLTYIFYFLLYQNNNEMISFPHLVHFNLTLLFMKITNYNAQ